MSFRKPLTVKEAQRLDRRAIDQLGIPSIVLMENAGRAVVQEILRLLKKSTRKTVYIFCGIGNNAGDGFVIGRYLIGTGVKTKVFLIGDKELLKPDAAKNYALLKESGCGIKKISKIDTKFFKKLSSVVIIVDAIFGVGLNRTIRDPFRSIIEALNQANKKIVAVDIPSGLDGTSGKIYGVCIKAFETVTFSYPKKGFFKNEGPSHVGRIVVVDIGIP